MQRERDEMVDGPYRRDFLTYDNHILDGDIFLQALNGFLMILDCNGELFFATHTIETYLGFHQVCMYNLGVPIFVFRTPFGPWESTNLKSTHGITPGLQEKAPN